MNLVEEKLKRGEYYEEKWYTNTVKSKKVIKIETNYTELYSDYADDDTFSDKI